ncbi:DUF1003 domain-containing protein [Sphingomonas arantia]|uniref:DUF1003 domain-containing protein n=1 Tax=Sphingomonas arantia TaxID=1460676 RepID=A0ABW4TT74_9SPHN
MNQPSDPTDIPERLLGRAAGTLDPEERRVVDSMAARRPISLDIGEEAENRATFWDRLADRVAAVGGSWAFIFTFLGVLVGWMILNTGILGRLGEAFDPYPYIFLNLMLSMVAALQAPVIMMSQNRQATKDRLAASHDYEVNLRAELEIMRLHEKIDALRIEHLEAMTHMQGEVITALRNNSTSSTAQ